MDNPRVLTTFAYYKCAIKKRIHINHAENQYTHIFFQKHLQGPGSNASINVVYHQGDGTDIKGSDRFRIRILQFPLQQRSCTMYAGVGKVD